MIKQEEKGSLTRLHYESNAKWLHNLGNEFESKTPTKLSLKINQKNTEGGKDKSYWSNPTRKQTKFPLPMKGSMIYWAWTGAGGANLLTKRMAVCKTFPTIGGAFGLLAKASVASFNSWNMFLVWGLRRDE